MGGWSMLVVVILSLLLLLLLGESRPTDVYIKQLKGRIEAKKNGTATHHRIHGRAVEQSTTDSELGTS